jgi:hypothetical protein
VSDRLVQEFPKTEKQKMLASELYLASEPELAVAVTRRISANVVAMAIPAELCGNCQYPAIHCAYWAA